MLNEGFGPCLRQASHAFGRQVVQPDRIRGEAPGPFLFTVMPTADRSCLRQMANAYGRQDRKEGDYLFWSEKAGVLVLVVVEI